MSLFGSSDKESTSTSNQISVIADIRAKRGHEDEVRTMFEKLAGPSRKEAGCLRYNVFEDKHDTGSFFTYEEWESEEALETHLSANKEGLNEVKTLLRQELSISILKQLA